MATLTTWHHKTTRYDNCCPGCGEEIAWEKLYQRMLKQSKKQAIVEHDSFEAKCPKCKRKIEVQAIIDFSITITR